MTSWRRWPASSASAVAACALLAGCGGSDSSALPQGADPVELDPADFTSEIDNPWMPFRTGSRWIYRETDGEGNVQRVEVTVLDETGEVMGIETRVVHDLVTQDGEPVEDTYDWYAQDADGNVWYFGEDTKEFENGRASDDRGVVGGRRRRRAAGGAYPCRAGSRTDVPPGVLRGRGRRRRRDPEPRGEGRGSARTLRRRAHDQGLHAVAAGDPRAQVLQHAASDWCLRFAISGGSDCEELLPSPSLSLRVHAPLTAPARVRACSSTRSLGRPPMSRRRRRGSRRSLGSQSASVTRARTRSPVAVVYLSGYLPQGTIGVGWAALRELPPPATPSPDSRAARGARGRLPDRGDQRSRARRLLGARRSRSSSGARPRASSGS